MEGSMLGAIISTTILQNLIYVCFNFEFKVMYMTYIYIAHMCTYMHMNYMVYIIYDIQSTTGM